MALDYKIINYKQKITRKGKTYIDLTSKSFNGQIETNGTFVRINEFYIARPDLISLAYYGDDQYGDLICKINGLSNPFELNKDMVLFIPELEYVLSTAKNFENGPSETIDDEKDEIGNIMQSEFIKKPNERRSSNNLLPGEKNYVIDKSLGFIFY